MKESDFFVTPEISRMLQIYISGIIKNAPNLGALVYHILFHIELLLELFNTPATAYEFLRSSKERVACGTNFNLHFFFDRLCLKRIAASTYYFTRLIIRMNSFFQLFHLHLQELTSTS